MAWHTTDIKWMLINSLFCCFFIKIIANKQKIIIKFKRFRKKTLTVLEKITKNKYIRELIGLDLVSGKTYNFLFY